MTICSQQNSKMAPKISAHYPCNRHNPWRMNMMDFTPVIRLWYIAEQQHSVTCLVESDSTIPWTVACQAPLLMGFSRQEYWNGMPILTPEDSS